MTRPSGAFAGVDFEDPSELPVEEVRDVFLTLSKTLRAYQLYDPNNPVYKRFVTNLRDAFSRIWESRDSIQLLVEEDRFTWMGEEVYRNESRTDSLAFLFFRDGIRDVTFEVGVEGAELERLLQALHQAKHARDDQDDLASILWDLDLQLFDYSAVNLAAEEVEMPPVEDPGPLDVYGVLREELGEAAPGEDEEEDEDGEAAGAATAGTVRTEDFNPLLYALDEEEKRYLKAERTKEMQRDLRGDVLNALFDRIEDRAEPDRQREIIGILRTLLPNFLGRGEVAAAARIIEEIETLRARDRVLAPEVADLAERLMDDLSSRETVQELVRAVQDGSMAPDAAELSKLTDHFRSGALEPLLKAAEETEDGTIRGVLRNAVHGIANANRPVAIRLLSSRDPAVARGAVRLMGRMRLAEASGPLAGMLASGPLEVRRVIVEVAEELQSSVLTGALVRLLRDEHRDLRVEAARVLGRTRYGPAAKELRAIVDGKQLRRADITEKVAFFEAYGMIAGEEGIEVLDRALNGRGFLGRRESHEIRAGAALALGKIDTPKARESLDRARNEEDPVVRTAVGRALRGERSGSEGGHDG